MSSSGPPPPPPTVVNPTLGKDREKLPGWNDPPEMAAGGSGIAAGNRNRLNKRVGFPTSSGSASGAQPTPPCQDPAFVMPLSTPPILQANLPPPPPSNVEITSAISNSDSTCGGPSTPATQEVPDLDILIDQLNAVMNSVGSGPDVRKRVALMQSKWNTLDVKVKVGVGQLTGCMADGDHEGAEKAQRALAVTHSSQCSAWIVAFKRLINDLKAKNQADLKTNEEVMQQNTGFMVPGDP